MHAHILAKYMHYMHTVILFENVIISREEPIESSTALKASVAPASLNNRNDRLLRKLFNWNTVLQFLYS